MPRRHSETTSTGTSRLLDTRRVEDRGEAMLYRHERCCDDCRRHDAIIGEMPLAAVSANAVIV